MTHFIPSNFVKHALDPDNTVLEESTWKVNFMASSRALTRGVSLDDDISELDPSHELTHRAFSRSAIKDYYIYPGPSELDRFIRAMNPWPMAWTQINLDHSAKDDVQRRLKIIKAHLDKSEKNQVKLILDEVQIEGKEPVSWKQFSQGYPDYQF